MNVFSSTGRSGPAPRRALSAHRRLFGVFLCSNKLPPRFWLSIVNFGGNTSEFFSPPPCGMFVLIEPLVLFGVVVDIRRRVIVD